jgi:hypothetical protein
MILTEDEAKTKRCQESYAASDGVTAGAPMATSVPQSIYGASGGTCIAVQTATAPMFCIGASCMAWRWQWSIAADGLHSHINDATSGKPLGYCGKAGRP